ncbi:MAG: DUF6476 family protein, partial [Arenibacterium sp.]
MSPPEEPVSEPANLRFLRRLVTVLTLVMICGLVVIVALFVIRFSARAPVMPDHITLPDGAIAESFTVSSDWYGVVVDNGARILIFDRPGGRFRQTIGITPKSAGYNTRVQNCLARRVNSP